MSRNSLKRSLALGSTLALAMAGLVAAPAQAAATLTVAPSAGSGTNVLSSDDFGFKVYGNADLAFAQFANLKWEISNPNSLTLGLTTNAAGVAQTGTTTVVATLTTPKTDGTINTLNVDPTITSATSQALSVRAFIDIDGSGTVSSADIVSNSLSVTWLGAADVAPAISFADPVAGASAKVSATIAGLNYDQTTGTNLKAIFIENAVAAGAVNFAVNADKDGLDASSAAASASGDIWGVKVQAYDYETNALKDVTTATYRSTVASSADAATLTMTKSSTVKGATDTVEYTVVGAFDALYATTEKTINAVATIKKSGAAVGAGVPVTVTVGEDAAAGGDSLTAGVTLKAGGETLTAAAGPVAPALAQSISYTAFTDANGQVAIQVVASAANDGDHFLIQVDSNTGTADIAVGWDDRAVSSIVETSGIAGVRQVVKGGAIPTQSYSVVDNYGANFVDADGTYRVRVVASGASGATVTQTAAYSGTPVSFALTDNSTTAGALTLTAHLEKLNAATPPAYAAIAAGAVTTTSTFQVATSFAAASTVTADTFITGAGPAKGAAYTSGTTADISLTLEAYKAVDVRTDSNTVSPNTLAVAGMLWLEGVVKDATGALVPGAPVTISGAGLAFKSGNVYTTNSLTVHADASGAYQIYVYSNQSGEKTLTVTAGAATKTAKVTFAKPSETTATSVTVNLTSAEPGKTMTVSGVVTDKFGNLVDNSDGDLTITYTGPGFINGSLPTHTDANGEYKFQVLIGANDTISGSVKVVLDGDSDGDNTDAETVTVSKDLAPAVPADNTKVNAGSFKGYVAIYAKGHMGKRLSAKVGNDWVVVPALASNFVRVVEYTGAGYTIAVRIYIDRVLVDTITVTTK